MGCSSSWVLVFIIHATTLLNLNNIDRFVFCRCRFPALRIRPGPQAKFSGHFRILSREYFPGSC